MMLFLMPEIHLSYIATLATTEVRIEWAGSGVDQMPEEEPHLAPHEVCKIGKADREKEVDSDQKAVGSLWDLNPKGVGPSR